MPERTGGKPVWQRVFGPFREFGPVVGFLYIISRVLSAISPRLGLMAYDFMVQPITDEPLVPARMMRRLQIRVIEAGDPVIGLMPVPDAVIRLRYAQGAVCLGAFQNEVFIGYLWLCFQQYDEDEVRCRYALSETEHAVFDFDFYLFPEHRLGLGFLGLWEGARQYLRARNVRYSFSRLTRYNLASSRAHAHLGWQRVGQALFLKLWPLELMVATIHPYVGFSMRPSGRIRLTLAAPTNASKLRECTEDEGA